MRLHAAIGRGRLSTLRVAPLNRDRVAPPPPLCHAISPRQTTLATLSRSFVLTPHSFPPPSFALAKLILLWDGLLCAARVRHDLKDSRREAHNILIKVIPTILTFAATVTGLCLHLRFGKWDDGANIMPLNSTSNTLDASDLSLDAGGLSLAPAVTFIGIFLGGFTIVTVLPL